MKNNGLVLIGVLFFLTSFACAHGSRDDDDYRWDGSGEGSDVDGGSLGHDEASGDGLEDGLEDGGSDALGDIWDAEGDDGSVQDEDGSQEELSALPIHRVELFVAESDWEYLHEDPLDRIAVPTSLSLLGQYFHDAELKIHGGYSRLLPKKSYRIKLQEAPTPLLNLYGDGAEEQKRFVLKAAWVDRTFMREALAMHLDRQSGVLAPRCAFAELYVNGEYHGFYVVEERIDKPFLKKQGLSTSDFHLFKAVSHQANWAHKAEPSAGFDIKYGSSSDVSDLGALLLALSSTETSDEAFLEEIESRLDVPSFVAWQRVHSFLDDQDTFTKNYYLYHDLSAERGSPQSLFQLIAWDADAILGNNWDGEPLDGLSEAWYGRDAFSKRLMAVPFWRAYYLDAYERALGEELSPQNVLSFVDLNGLNVSNFARRDLERWQPEESWDVEMRRLVDVIRLRHETMRAVIEGLLR